MVAGAGCATAGVGLVEAAGWAALAWAGLACVGLVGAGLLGATGWAVAVGFGLVGAADWAVAVGLSAVGAVLAAPFGWAGLVGTAGWLCAAPRLIKAAAPCVFAGPGLVEAGVWAALG